MSDLQLAEKDPALILSEALATYKQITGQDLAPADPRRLHLQALLLIVSQLRQLIDFSGKQSLLRFVSDLFIDALSELWIGTEGRIPAAPSQCTERFNFGVLGSYTIPDKTRVSDGKNFWEVEGDTSNTGTFVDATVKCITPGRASNGVAIGQIDTLVDPSDLPGCTGVTNTTETISGRDVEGLEDFRARLRNEPEARSTCGPRAAYEAAALEASENVADAAAIGPDDFGEVFYTTPGPGEIWLLIIKGERDEQGALISVVPDPDDGLLNTVAASVTGEQVRPLGDFVTVLRPQFVDFDAICSYTIGQSRAKQAVQIQLAVQQAFSDYLLWQQSKISRDINPSELTARLVNAGAKRVIITSPTFQVLVRDQSARCVYQFLGYDGVEND